MAVDLYTPTKLGIAPRKFFFIIIHDTNCQWEMSDYYKIDKGMFQAGPMRARFRNEKHYDEFPYHFIVERIGENFQTIVGRPLQYSCKNEYPDIDTYYSKYGIHVCLMGNYNGNFVLPKMYQQLAYRVICPMMKAYRITKSRILTHGEISKEHPDCPGFNFSKQTLFAFMTKFLIGVNS